MEFIFISFKVAFFCVYRCEKKILVFESTSIEIATLWIQAIQYFTDFYLLDSSGSLPEDTYDNSVIHRLLSTF